MKKLIAIIHNLPLSITTRCICVKCLYFFSFYFYKVFCTITANSFQTKGTKEVLMLSMTNLSVQQVILKQLL